MIILLGHTGYVGSAFAQLLEQKNIPFRGISRSEVDYYDSFQLSALIKATKATFLINAAGYTGKPNVDACELQKTETLLGNAILPGIIREVCEDEELPWGHVSSGCIFSGRRADGQPFTEEDPANFSFRTDNCSFYSGTKALGEEVLEGAQNCFIWRLRIPFNNIDSPRNYLTKLLRYDRLLEAENSISHLEEFVAACLACHEKQIQPGIYNVTNPGAITTHEVVDLIKTHLQPKKSFSFFDSEEEFMSLAAKTPRSNCVLDSSKLESAGIHLRPVEEAIVDSLKKWEN